MTSFTKKNRRNRKKEAQQELKEKVGLFNKLSDECLVCQKNFDKQNKEMVMAWSVIVRKDTVRLYCPECWDRANKLIKEMEDGYTNAKTNV